MAGTARAEGEYITECVTRATQQAQTAGKYTGYGMANNTFCLLGGWIGTGGELSFTANFEAGTSYLIVGAGDRDVKDLDLGIQNGENLIADTEDDNTPFVHVEATESVEATITLVNETGSGSPDFCVVIILQSEGGEGNTANMNAAAAGLVKAVGGVGGGWSTAAAEDPSGWCLVGGLFGSGGELGMSRGFSAGHYALVGFGDSQCKDLDCYVANAEGEPVAADTETDSTPVVQFDSNGEASGSLSLRMAEADGNAFGVAIILKKQ
jgi:hypothetical protein